VDKTQPEKSSQAGKTKKGKKKKKLAIQDPSGTG
jgi:hypothetical protein